MSIKEEKTASLSVDEITDLVDNSGRIVTVPMTTFCATALVGVPIFCAILPVSIAFQVGKAVLRTIWKPTYPALDNGIVVDSKDIKDRKDRTYDVVLLGPTGFTGVLTARYMAKNCAGLKWAIAGRSQKKLDALKKDLAKLLGDEKLLKLETIVVDLSDVSTLPTLVKDTRVLMTAVGPFNETGSPVVECCAKYGTHYLDITGEFPWATNMMLKWDATAQKTGAKMVPHSGVDSIPWDLMVMKFESSLEKGETLKKVTFLDRYEADLTGGTVSSLLIDVEGKARPMLDHPFHPALKLPDGTKSPCDIEWQYPVFIHQWKEAGRFRGASISFAFFSLCNSGVVKRSTALRQVSNGMEYFEARAFPDFKSAFVDLFSMALLVTMLSNPITGALLRFVLPKPGQGPSLDDMQNKSFAAISANAEGSKGTRLQAVWKFDSDGYIETARMFSESAICLAKYEDQLPAKGGGFFTPSTCMGQFLLDRLQKTGTLFAMERLSGSA